MARMPRNQLLDQLFALFPETPRWSISPLLEKTQQPEVYLKEVLCRLYDGEQRQRHILFLFSFSLVISPFFSLIPRRYIYRLILPFDVSASNTAIGNRRGRRNLIVMSNPLSAFIQPLLLTYWLALLLLKLSITNHIQLVSEVTISIVSRFRKSS